MAATVTRRTRARGLALVVAIASVAAACGSDDGDTREPAAAAPSPFHMMGDALCDAADQAANGDAARSRRAFLDGAHQPLHQLAADTAEHDRAVAADLLEAKEAVESADDGNLPAAYDRLLPAAAAALDVVDGPALPCTPKDTP